MCCLDRYQLSPKLCFRKPAVSQLGVSEGTPKKTDGNAGAFASARPKASQSPAPKLHDLPSFLGLGTHLSALGEELFDLS